MSEQQLKLKGEHLPSLMRECVTALMTDSLDALEEC